MKNGTEFILYVATTLDGYIASSNGGLEWLTAFETDDAEDSYTAFYATIDALIMGATTYEQVLEFGDWPYPGKLSYVLTSRNLSTDRDDIVFFSQIEALLEDIKHQGFRRVWIVGGGKVASLLMAQGLVDESILTIIPIILGAGISLYQTAPLQMLNLVRTKSYASGAVELHYKKMADEH